MADKKKENTKKNAPVLYAKKTMNFARHQSSFDIKKVLPILVLVLISFLAFVKIGIMDPLEDKMHAYSVLSYKQSQLVEANAKLAGFEDLQKEYGRYSYGWMNENEVNTVNRIDVLNLVEQKIAPTASISDLRISNNILTLNINGITLEEASVMVISLEQSPMVDSAFLHNAVSATAEEAAISMSLILTKEVEE